MKKIRFTLSLFLFSALAWAQAPQKMSYQAVIRDASSNLVTNSPIGMQISILQGSATGTPVYVETQSATSNMNGLVSIEIGMGTVVTGSFSSINWASGPYFIKTETDPSGGSSYSISGTTQLMSVPYALYAETSGTSGPQGPNGFNTLIKNTIESAGTNCHNGGVKIESGLDINSNNILDAGEITSTSYVCNGDTGAAGAAGANGSNGFNTLIKNTIEAAGTNCHNGGRKIESGLDVNSNNVLDAGEVTSTSYVCNGDTGAAGAAGTNGTNGFNTLIKNSIEAAGTNCHNGGRKIESGLDVNSNNVLDAGEVNSTSYVCNGDTGAAGAAGTNGTNGFNTLIKNSIEAAGTNCHNGGRKIESGLDINSNNVLDAGEVTSTSYVCNGDTGATGPLVSGTIGQTLFHNGTTWAPSSNLSNTGSLVGIGINPANYPFHVYKTGMNSGGYMGYTEAYGAASSTLISFGSYVGASGSGDGYAVQGNGYAASGNAIGGSFFGQGAGAGFKIGVDASASGSTVGNYGIRSIVSSSSGGTNYGVYGSAASGPTNWAGYFASGNVFVQNSLGVGTAPASALVQVRGLTGSSTVSYGFRVENSLGSGLFYVRDDGFVGVGTSSGFKFSVNGNVGIPATSSYRYNTAKTKKYRIGFADMSSANSSVYTARIDDGFSSGTVNGLNSMWATGGTAGTVAYFVAPVHLPDSGVITGLLAQLIKNGGTLQGVVELYRTAASGYLANDAQLIATASTTSSAGAVVTVAASSVNASFNVVDNANYTYFIRYSGEQNTQALRFLNATITYQIYRSDY